ncbi:tRNA adenosine deaminase-associated protein [Corynebacterium kroppenstedtii]|uniref:tRNA adenosine deaminase-associated protein n=1 Tax=Corynebacterium sp. PCR 32 TaxID=3351342 RepID=UPI0030AE1280
MNAGANDDNQTPTFAVALTSQDGQWMVRSLPEQAAWDLDVAVRALRDLRSEGPSFGMVCVDDDWFVLIRPTPRGTRLLLSDATAAVVDDYAADVLDELDVDTPDIDPDDRADAEPWPEGDFEMLEDLGVPSQVLTVICDDDELWASEQLLRIAEELNVDEDLADIAQLDY